MTVAVSEELALNREGGKLARRHETGLPGSKSDSEGRREFRADGQSHNAEQHTATQ
jgi:hypothetical protein